MGAIYILGNAVVDLVLPVPAIVRPGETVVASSATRAPGGKGLNQAVVSARAGASVTFCYPIGDDENAALIEDALLAEPFTSRKPLRKLTSTDVSIILVAADGENSIVTVCGCADAVSEKEAASFASLATSDDWLVLQGNLAEGPSLAAVRAACGHILFNPAPIRWRVDTLLPYCDIVVANSLEATDLSGTTDPLGAIEWFRAHGVPTSVVTLGAAGCIWEDLTGAGQEPAPTVEVKDTSGAGDTFCGVLAARLAAGFGMRAAVHSAQYAAALSVTRSGTFDALPTKSELQNKSRPP